ncbi:MAG: substrate-binding domain-containing protein [Alphaproteobacteria bacterium]|nr:substrate-binding domain-containing protein [Alphaproteobacteria bacterium]
MAQKLICISSMATRHILAEISASHAAASGRKIDVNSMGGVDAAKRVESGEAVDIVVLASGALAKLARGGSVRADSIVDIARSALAAAVKAGPAKPDLSSDDSAKRALLGARAIAYSTGPSGDHIVALFKRWEIFAAIEARLVKAPPGVPVGKLVADGAAEIGFQQLSELQGLPGIDIVGPLSPALQSVTNFAAGVAAAAADSQAAAGFIAALRAPAVREVYIRHGMEPA